MKIRRRTYALDQITKIIKLEVSENIFDKV